MPPHKPPSENPTTPIPSPGPSSSTAPPTPESEPSHPQLSPDAGDKADAILHAVEEATVASRSQEAPSEGKPSVPLEDTTPVHDTASADPSVAGGLAVPARTASHESAEISPKGNKLISVIIK